MKRLLLVSIATLALALSACGNDDGTNNGNNGENNGSNNGSNNGGSNNGSNNGGSNNGSNNGGTNNGGTNNGGTNNGGTNNGGTNNGGTNNGANNGMGNISFTFTMSPTQMSVGDMFTLNLTLTNFTLDPNNILGANADGMGHYTVHLDTQDADHLVARSADNPGTFPLELDQVQIDAGAHTLYIELVQNDGTSYQTPVVGTIDITVQ